MKTLTIPDGYELNFFLGWGLTLREADLGNRQTGDKLVAVSIEAGVLDQRKIDESATRLKQVIDYKKQEAIAWNTETKCECQ